MSSQILDLNKDAILAEELLSNYMAEEVPPIVEVDSRAEEDEDENEENNEENDDEEYDKYNDSDYWDRVNDYTLKVEKLVEQLENVEDIDTGIAKTIAMTTPIQNVNDILEDPDGDDDDENQAEDSYKKYLDTVKSLFMKSKDDKGKSFFTYKLESFIADALFDDKYALSNTKNSLVECIKKSFPIITINTYNIYQILSEGKKSLASKILKDVLAHSNGSIYIISVNKGKTKLIFNAKAIRLTQRLLDMNIKCMINKAITLCVVVGKDYEKYLYKLNYAFNLPNPFTVNTHGAISTFTPSLQNGSNIGAPKTPTYRSIKDIIKLPDNEEWNNLQSPVKDLMYSYVSNWVALNKANIEAKVPTQLGLTISGPKGCGKTTLAKQIAYNLGLTVKFVDYSDIEKSLNYLNPYTMVIFDDADCAFGVRAQQVQGTVNRSILAQSNAMTSRKELIEFNKLLGFIQGQVAHVGIIFVLITNYKDSIDTALTSRFGREFVMDYFSKEETKQYCEYNEVPFDLIDKLFKSEYPICPRQLEATCKEYHSRVFARKNQLFAEFICEKIAKKEKEGGDK